MTDKKEIYCQAWTVDGCHSFTWEQWYDSNIRDRLRIHYENGPAVIYSDGRKEWWINNQLHRTDGPAVIRSNGKRLWFQNGQLHRPDGPAIEYTNGYYEWYLNGKLHRTDGPAMMIDPNGTEEWCTNGQILDKIQVENWLQENKIDISTPEGQTAFKLRWS